MPGLNFTAMLDDAQAASRNGLSSGDEETAATPGQRRVGSRARASNRAADRPPDVRLASPAAATLASTRPPLQSREQQFDQLGAPPPPFITRPEPRPIVYILDVAQQPERRAWLDDSDIRAANARHDIAAILHDGVERPLEHDLHQHEHALPQAPGLFRICGARMACRTGPECQASTLGRPTLRASGISARLSRCLLQHAGPRSRPTSHTGPSL